MNTVRAPGVIGQRLNGMTTLKGNAMATRDSMTLMVLFVISTSSGGIRISRADPVVRRANSIERIVRLDFPVTNTSDQDQDLMVYLALPQSNPRQDVLSVYPEPGYDRILDDADGNRIVAYADPGVKPGEMRRHGWIAAVRTYAAVHEPSANVEPLGEEEQSRYTRDTPKYLITSPVVSALRDAPADMLQPALEETEAALEQNMPPESLAEITKDTLRREVLLLLINRLDRSRYPNLAEELFRARHPTALYLSVYCDHLGVPMPTFLVFPLLTDDYLRSEILQHRAAGAWNWKSFEHWWRKARPHISFCDERKVFILHKKDIDLN